MSAQNDLNYAIARQRQTVAQLQANWLMGYAERQFQRSIKGLLPEPEKSA